MTEAPRDLPPRSSLPSEVLALLVFGVFFVLVAPGYEELLANSDIGSQLTKGWEILHGRHPWTDIDSSVYGPAIFYLSALAQTVDGERLFPEIILIFTGYLVSYLLLFRTWNALSDRRWLFLSYALIAIIAFPRFHKYHVLLPQALFLFGLYKALSVQEPRRAARRLAVTAVLAGLFRLDFGVYSVLASVLFLVLRYRSSGWRPVLDSCGVLLVTGFILTSPWLVFLALAGEPIEIMRTSWQTGLGVLRGLNLPLSPYAWGSPPLSRGNLLFLLHWFFRLAPIAVLVACLVRAWRREANNGDGMVDSQRGDLYLVVSAVFALMVYQQAEHRIGLSHVKQSLQAGLFVFFLAVARMGPSWPTMGRAARGFYFLTLGIPILFLGWGLKHPRLTKPSAISMSRSLDNGASWFQPRQVALENTLADDRREHGYSQQLAKVLLRLRELTSPDDPVLILPYYSQTYYFADRGFATPHGWWNPARFLGEGSQTRFVRAMSTTRVLADVPSFSFDGMPSRNSRAYAPEVMRHIYSEYGLFERIGRFFLLSSDPRMFRERGSFQLSFQKSETAGIEERDHPEDCGVSGYRVSHVNTLPVASMGESFSLPHGGALLLGTEKCGAATADRSCSTLALSGNSGLFRIHDRHRPLPIDALRRDTLIDTHMVPAGSYVLVEVSCSASADEPQPTGPTGLRLTFRASKLLK